MPYLGNSQSCRVKVKPCLHENSVITQITETGQSE